MGMWSDGGHPTFSWDLGGFPQSHRLSLSRAGLSPHADIQMQTGAG